MRPGVAARAPCDQRAGATDDLLAISQVPRQPADFTWDVGAGLPLLLGDGTAQYLYGPGGLLLEQVLGTTRYYYHPDHLGSMRALTDGSGTVQDSYTYDAYGQTTASGAITNPFRYTGQYQDSESGLYYLRARYYDPATQQFLSVDPLAALTGTPYAYAAGNPVNGIDPSGLAWADEDWGHSPTLGPADPNAIPFPAPQYPPAPHRISFADDGPLAAYWGAADFVEWLSSSGPYEKGANGGGFLTPPCPYQVGAQLDQPFIDELVRELKARYGPNYNVRANFLRTASNGRVYEIDVETDSAIIEVKSGAANGLHSQVVIRINDRLLNPSGKPVIGYGPQRMKPTIAENIDRDGGIAAWDLEELMQILAP